MMRPARVFRVGWIASLGLSLCCGLAPALEDEPARLGGKLAQTTTSALFLDAGRQAGLFLGARIDIIRGQQVVASLQVQHLADHYASIPIPVGVVILASDAWHLDEAIETVVSSDLPSVAESSTLRGTEEGLDPDVSAAAWATARERPWQKTDYQGQQSRVVAARSPIPPFLRVTTAMRSWTSSGASANHRIGPGAQLRFDSAVGTGLCLELEADAVGWAVEPDGEAFEPTGAAFVLVRRLAAVYRRGSFVTQLGRSRPLEAPGASLQDGVVVTWRRHNVARRADRGISLGLYGGVIPKSNDLHPSNERGVLGAYARLRRILSEGRFLTIAGRAERRSEFNGTVDETEALASFRPTPRTQLGAGGMLRTSVGGWDLPAVWLRGILLGTSGTAWASWRQSQSVPITTSSLPAELVSAGTRRQTEAGLRTRVLGSVDLGATLGRVSGSTGFERWGSRVNLSDSLEWWRLSGWSLVYSGALGWHEGHEGELGLQLVGRGFNIDLRGGGGVSHQDRTDQIVPVAHAALGLFGPLSEHFILDCELKLWTGADNIGAQAWLAIAYGM